MPSSASNRQLAEEFVEFFHTKTEKKLGEKFKDIEAYQPRQLDVTLLRKFAPVTTSEQEKTIRGIPWKKCQLDIIPIDEKRRY